MKKIFALLLALALVLGMVACGAKEEAAAPAAKEEAAPAAKEEAAAPEAEGPADTGELVLYSSWAEDRVNPLVQGFTELTGIEVSVVTGGTSELINRIVAEKDNPLGDVLWGGSTSSYGPIKDYLMTYDTTEMDALSPNCIDPDHKWYGFSVEPLCLIYNTKLVAEEDIPTGWKDLIDPKWAGKMAVVDPTKSSASYATFLAILEAFGKDDGKGYEFVKEVIANAQGNILSSSSLSYKTVADGEYMISLTTEESAMKYIMDGHDLGMVFPEEGTDAIVSPIAGIKGGPNEKSAQLFIDYMVGIEVQTQLSEWGIRSSRSDVPVNENSIPMDQIKLLDMDADWIAANGDAFKEWWKDAVTE